jgi:hypothetical protein
MFQFHHILPKSLVSHRVFDILVGRFNHDAITKLLVWDKVLGFGQTDGLAGFASVTANLVVSFYFAKRGFENVARIIKR